MQVTPFGRELKRLRADQGLTVRDLAKRLHKSIAYVGKIGCYVADDLTVDKVERAAKAMAAAGAPAFITSNKSGVTVTEREREGARTIIPGRSYAPGG